MLLQKINKIFFILLLGVTANLFAATPWEVGVIFLGKNEDSLFQKDIQNKILDLKQVNQISNLTITSLIEDQKTSDNEYSTFFKKAFKNKASKKFLLIYSHGLGPDGLKDYSTIELKETILKKSPHLDMLWFDACFMANIEFLFEIRKNSQFTIASEDSEFSSGLVFSSLAVLPNFDNAFDASKSLADNYINSYSYSKNGSLKDNVKLSSATISVIENSKLDNFANSLKEMKSIYNELNPETKLKLSKRLRNKFVMDNNDLVDLGHFLIELRLENKNPAYDKTLTSLIRKLNIQSVKSIKTNPRIQINTPASNEETIFVWGFDNFKSGDSIDFKNSAEIYNAILKPDGFIDGPNHKKWPFKKIRKGVYGLTPFAPGIKEFNYYFLTLDQKTKLSNIQVVTRATDVVSIDRITTDSPLAFSAYTQEIGINAERYTGLNITIPGTVPSLDYIDYEFNQLVDWLQL